MHWDADVRKKAYRLVKRRKIYWLEGALLTVDDQAYVVRSPINHGAGGLFGKISREMAIHI